MESKGVKRVLISANSRTRALALYVIKENIKMLKGSHMKKNYLHIGFEIGLLWKGIDSLFEIIGGVLLMFLNPDRLNRLIAFFTYHELSEDPRDKIANLLVSLGSSFSISTQSFGVFYLISHGIIKCLLIFFLWRTKLWAYPISILSLILFIAYQIYRYSISQSVFLIVLTILDMVMILLTYVEYRRMRL